MYSVSKKFVRPGDFKKYNLLEREKPVHALTTNSVGNGFKVLVMPRQNFHPL